jgi:hypothetical protein
MNVLVILAVIGATVGLGYFAFNKVREARRIYNFHEEQ